MLLPALYLEVALYKFTITTTITGDIWLFSGEKLLEKYARFVSDEVHLVAHCSDDVVGRFS